MTNFWKEKKVLITGYEGFLGSALTKALLACGADIFGLDIVTHRNKTILSKEDLGKISIIKGSVENFDLISKILKDNQIEIIFHLAAKALVGECLDDPLKCFSVNIKGTWNVLEAARNSSAVKSIVIASSDKAYGDSEKLPYKEDYPLQGCFPYEVSKSCTDLIANTYFKTYGLPVCITRCGNIYGPIDFNFSRIVPETIRCILKEKTLLIRSDGKLIRDYIYVKDIVNGYIKLAEKMKNKKIWGEAFNFSDEKPLSVIQLVKNIYKILGKKPCYKVLDHAKYEIKDQYLQSRKARKLLKWKPNYNMGKAVKETYEWYGRFLKNEK